MEKSWWEEKCEGGREGAGGRGGKQRRIYTVILYYSTYRTRCGPRDAVASTRPRGRRALERPGDRETGFPDQNTPPRFLVQNPQNKVPATMGHLLCPTRWRMYLII